MLQHHKIILLFFFLGRPLIRVGRGKEIRVGRGKEKFYIFKFKFLRNVVTTYTKVHT